MFLLFVLSAQVHASVDEFPMRALGEKLPRKTFDRIITLFETTFSPLAAASGRQLEFMTDYDEDWVQAFARRWETDQVIVYGGTAAVNNGSEDTFALILCHETGHLYGGEPVSDPQNHLSVEGQADYWATQTCLPKLLSSLSERNPTASSIKYCNGDKSCARIVDAALALTAQFADNRNLPHPALTTPDETIVATLNYTHASPQCRLDTMMAGMKKLPQPRCWYKSPETL
jgi:hypothetical protein